MHDPVPHLADFHFAHQCLEGEAPALTALQERHAQPTRKFLMASGATEGEACDVVEMLWGDLFSATSGRAPAIARYNGNCALQTWLNTVALNKLLTRKRTEERWKALIPHRVGIAESDAQEWGDASIPSDAETPLLELMRDAVEAAFLQCLPEQFVLLQLVHCDGLRMLEVARMFNCSEGTISRQLERARHDIQAATLARIKATDPWLELKWEDFLALCGTATPACFGVED